MVGNKLVARSELWRVDWISNKWSAAPSQTAKKNSQQVFFSEIKCFWGSHQCFLAICQATTALVKLWAGQNFVLKSKQYKLSWNHNLRVFVEGRVTVVFLGVGRESPSTFSYLLFQPDLQLKTWLWHFPSKQSNQSTRNSWKRVFDPSWLLLEKVCKTEINLTKLWKDERDHFLGICIVLLSSLNTRVTSSKSLKP